MHLDAAALTRALLRSCVAAAAAVRGPGDNMIGPIMHDEEVFATQEVTCVGQVGGPAAA